MTDMDFQNDAEQESASDGELSRIARLVDQYEDAEDEVLHLEEKLKEAKQHRDQLSGRDIPAAMDEAGMSELRLADGRPVRVETGVRASIAKKDKEAAFAWLEENGYGDLVKAEMKLNVGRGEAELLNTLAERIMEEHGWTPGVEQKVHPQTLAAFVRERRAEGDDIPEDLLGVYEFRKTKVG